MKLSSQQKNATYYEINSARMNNRPQPEGLIKTEKTQKCGFRWMQVISLSTFLCFFLISTTHHFPTWPIIATHQGLSQPLSPKRAFARPADEQRPDWNCPVLVAYIDLDQRAVRKDMFWQVNTRSYNNGTDWGLFQNAPAYIRTRRLSLWA